MDPILKIIKYIFHKNNIQEPESFYTSIDSFFENGETFPKFVKILFPNEEFPIYQEFVFSDKSIKDANNKLTLQFLFDNNKEIANLKPNYDNQEERKNLLSLILSKQYLQDSFSDIINKCNRITKTIGIIYKDENEFIRISTLISILHVLSNGLIEKNSTNFFDQELINNIFNKVKVPLVIDEKSLTQPYKYQFYIQIQIIFDLLSDSPNNQIFFDNQDEVDENLLNYSYNLPKFIHNSQENFDELQMIHASFLKVLNAIGQKWGFQFNDFIQIIKDDSLPKFIMHFFNVSSIENVIFSNEQTLTQKIQNIEAVIEFLKKKDELFSVLLFNFRNPKTVEESLFTLIYNFLNTFYMGGSKEMIEKRKNSFFINNKIDIKNEYYKQFINVLQFYTREKIGFDLNKVEITDEIAYPFFKKANVPMIINQFLLRNRNEVKFELIDFQWKLIFDTIDDYKPYFKIVEQFINSFKSFQKIKVSRYELILAKIKARNSSFKQYNTQNIIKKHVKKDKNEINLPKSFKQRFLNSQVQIKTQNENNCNISIIENYEEFWNTPEKFLSLDNGILFEGNEKEQLMQKWDSEITKLKKNIEISDPGTNENENQLLSFKSSSNNFESEFYKLFYYNEDQKMWISDDSNFKKLFNDKKIDLNCSKTSLVLILESFMKDSKSMISNMINGSFPNLENEEQIFIYGLCDRTLSMLNYSIDFTNKLKASIKPIFLLLHIPESKKNIQNIEIIITQIYAYLSSISNLNIIILNKNHYVHQFQYIEYIFNIYTTFSENLKFLFLINDEKINSNQEIDEMLNQKSIFSNLVSKINIKNKFTYINIFNANTYRSFLSLFNEIVLRYFSEIGEVNNKLRIMYSYIFNGVYFYLKMQISTWKKDMENIIRQRFSFFKSKEKYRSNPFGILHKIQKEILRVFPDKDSYFMNEIISLISEIKEELIQKQRENFISEIQISSELDLKYIEQSLKERSFWTYEQMKIIRDSHIRFLQEEFLDIIQITFSKKMSDIIYDDNYFIVATQIENDDKILNAFFKPYKDIIKAKKIFYEQDIHSVHQQGTNYTVKETENLREIKVTVEIDQKLDSVIEQDF